MKYKDENEREIIHGHSIFIEDLGMKYPTPESKKKRAFVLIKCGVCGDEFERLKQNDHTRPCKKCSYLVRKPTKHGYYKTRLFSIWNGMKKRCYTKSTTAFHLYGGRGITVCNEWKSDFMIFRVWALDNGYTDKLTIDRINNDGNYEPSNCRWVNMTIQCRNHRILKRNTTGQIGVTWSGRPNYPYTAQITVEGKVKHLGRFKTAKKAGLIRDSYIILHELEGYTLNNKRIVA